MIRVLLAAAGGQSKWGGHLGVPSHLVPLPDGTPLLARTIAQVREFTDDVHLTCPPADPRYVLPGVAVHPQEQPAASEYGGTRPWWNPDGRTVLLLGDVYFTDRALDTIRDTTERQYRVFGRHGPSRITGTPYGEIFAISWWPAQHDDLDRHLDRVHRTRAAGTITRPPGWMLLRSMQGTPLGRHLVKRPPFVDVDDETDDIDKPVDYERHPAFRGGRARG